MVMPIVPLTGQVEWLRACCCGGRVVIEMKVEGSSSSSRIE